jgi:LCP family protein required for cell wall assembly
MPKQVPNEEGLRALGQVTGGTTSVGGDGPIPNEDGLRALGKEVDESHAPSGRHARAGRHRKLWWTVGVVGLVVVLCVAAAGAYLWHLNDEVHRVVVGGLTPAASQGKDAGTENILMVGSTSRCALTHQTPAYGLCTEGVTGVNSDVVMILHLNPVGPTVSILSIPRDLFVPNARNDGANKIDAALYNGPTQLVSAIEEDFGIPIQHYVELNFDSFANVVTALGGITMEFPEPVFDAESGLNVMVPGCHHLNGKEALEVVRARHLQYKSPTVTYSTPHTWPQESESDLARIRRDHEFLRVLATAVSKKGLSNPFTDQSLVSSVAPQLTVDSGLSATDMASLLITFHSVSVGKAPQLTLPVMVDNFGSYNYEGGTYGDIEFPPEPQDQGVVDQFLGITADTNTLTGGRLPSPSGVTVTVDNGTGAADQATATAAALGHLGFQASAGNTVAPVGHEAETVVSYGQKSPTNEAAAQLVARSLSGSVIMAYVPSLGGSEVTVTTGSDFSVDPTPPAPAAPKPAHKKGHGTTTTTTSPPVSTTSSPGTTSTSSTGSTATSSTGSTSSTTTTTSATSNFTAPTQSVQALAPWDPRACPTPAAKG